MTYSEVDVLNFVEGRLDDQQTAQFLSQLRTDPALAAAVEVMQASQLPIAQAYELHNTPTVPDSLRNHIDALAVSAVSQETKQHSLTSSLVTDIASSKQSTNESNTHSSKSRIGKLPAIGLAACLLSGVGIGALATQFYVQQNPKQTNTASVELDAVQLSGELKHNRLVKRIADYQSLYVENTVANLSDAPIDDARELFKSINDTGRTQPSIPDFTDFGYQFARAQELGFEGQTLVQLVYKKAGSAPLALCFMRDIATQSLPMNISEHHGLNVASWASDHHHFVLVAEEPDTLMNQLYEAASTVL